jgi:hypothetical protein
MTRLRATLAALVDSPWRLALAWAGLAALAGLIVWAAPEEKTLGGTIRWVYVALTWTGMLGIGLAGALGLALAVSGRAGLAGWMRPAGLVGLGFFAAGLAVSGFAAGATWGGMFWEEPRTRANLQVLAVGVIVGVAAPWLANPRGQGVLFALLTAVMFGLVAGAQLVLHPRSPILSAASPAIPATFFGLGAVSSLAALGLVAHLRRRAR